MNLCGSHRLNRGMVGDLGLPETRIGTGEIHQARARDCESTYEYGPMQDWTHLC